MRYKKFCNKKDFVKLKCILKTNVKSKMSEMNYKF